MTDGEKEKDTQAEEPGKHGRPQEEGYSDEEEAEVQKRLEDLGYIE